MFKKKKRPPVALVVRQLVCQSPKGDVKVGETIEAATKTTYPGILRLIAFLSGVSKNFEIIGVSINEESLHQINDAWTVAGLAVEENTIIRIMAKNVSKEARPFCFQVTMDVDADILPPRRHVAGR